MGGKERGKSGLRNIKLEIFMWMIPLNGFGRLKLLNCILSWMQNSDRDTAEACGQKFLYYLFFIKANIFEERCKI